MITGQRKVTCTALILETGWSVTVHQVPEQDDPEAEEDCGLDSGGHRDGAETLGQPGVVIQTYGGFMLDSPISNIRHLFLILVHITTEDDEGQAFEEQSTLLLLQLLAVE